MCFVIVLHCNLRCIACCHCICIVISSWSLNCVVFNKNIDYGQSHCCFRFGACVKTNHWFWTIIPPAEICLFPMEFFNKNIDSGQWDLRLRICSFFIWILKEKHWVWTAIFPAENWFVFNWSVWEKTMIVESHTSGLELDSFQ